MEEFVTNIIGFNINHISRVLRLLQFIPENYNIVKRVYTSFQNLHYDLPIENESEGILYSLPGARVHELRGKFILLPLEKRKSTMLITLACSISEENSVLDILNLQYCETMERRKKKQKTFSNVEDYLNWSLKEPQQLYKLNEKVFLLYLYLVSTSFKHCLNIISTLLPHYRNIVFALSLH